MVEHKRRRVLQAAGLAIAGGALTTGVATAQEDDGESPALEEAAGWSSLGGGPGNNPVASSGPEAPVTVDWEYEHGGPLAVADGRVYLTAGGEVHALDAADGSLAWRTDDIGASGTPAVTDEAVYVGGERLTRIERGGEICCQADLGYDEAIPSPVVADGLVLVAAAGVLYATDTRDLEVQWRFDPADGTLYEQPVAVADDAVFATSESRLFARELADGTHRWTDDDPTGNDEYSRFTAPSDRQISHPVATDDVVAVGSVDTEPGAVWAGGYTTLYDAATGVKRTTSDRAPITPGAITDERFFARSMHDLMGYDRETGEENWEMEYNMYHVSSGVVTDDTVYAGVTVNGEAYGPENMPDPATGVYAFDENGETQWAIATDERPVLALVDGTLYAGGETLRAIRSENASGDGEDGDGDEGADDGEDDGAPEDDGESSDDEPSDEADGNGGDDGSSESDGGTGANETDDGNGTDDGAEQRTAGDRATEDSDESGGETNESDNETNESDGDEEGTPGFTAGAGITGGALTLEWLRRRASDDAAAPDEEA